MLKPTCLIERPEMWLAGFAFYGDPFQLRGGWDEENEIGRLWRRFGRFCAEQAASLPAALEPGTGYEVHIQHLETGERGEYEVFVGFQVEPEAGIPIQFSLKRLPPAQYAVFTLRGAEITADWDAQISAWLAGAGWVSDFGFNLQCYDARFKGMQGLADSEVDVWVPVRRAGE